MSGFAPLERWKGTLDKCIRCGYCFEHCPIYKATRWEIDSPRGKLILLYGLLSGEVAPTDYVANKLLECFHCNRCQKACSSGVPIQQVYSDARALLIASGFDVVGTTSQTDHAVCALCLACVRMCPHEARKFLDGRIRTDRLKCASCGSCLDICPAEAVTIARGYGTNPDELLQAVRSFFARHRSAKVVVFSCSWSTYPGLQSARPEEEETDPETLTLVTVCSGRVTSRTVLETLRHGAWGVLICCCPEDDCEHGGSRRAKARLSRLAGVLRQTGIDPRRIQVCEVPQGNTRLFGEAREQFLSEIRSLGPLLKGGPT